MTQQLTPRLLDAGRSPGAPGPTLVWDLPSPMIGISSAVVGGGIGPVSWVLNMTVDADYGRLDPDRHLIGVAEQFGLNGPGIAMMTAVDVSNHEIAHVDGVATCATVGVSRPVWAADLTGDSTGEPAVDPGDVQPPGTINLVVTVPVRLGDAALVNIVATATEAKVQALLDCSVDGTGTASDAIGVLCPAAGPSELFGGPRSTWGARVAHAVYVATTAGVIAQRR